ncbi:MAG: DUF2723 domain-containing protein [Chloroflexota bacterium]
MTDETAAIVAPVAAPPEPGWLRRSAPYLVPALLVFAGSLLLDLRTLMPGLGFWDTGEFQTIGTTLGIAHPTGYPSYTLLLWLTSVLLQPFGEPALRANLTSALLVSGAAALTAVAVVQVTRRPVIGIAAGALLAVAPLAWENAVRADPHAFHLFLGALLLVVLLAWAARERAGRPDAGRWLVLGAVVFGVSLGNHALTLLMAPGVALFVLAVNPRILWRRWRLVLGCLLAVAVVTVLVYAYLPLRSSMGPPLDYAHPADWVRTDEQGRVVGGFRYLVLGEQFRGTFHEWPTMAQAAADVWDVVVQQLGLAAPLAVLGVLAGIWRRPSLMALTIPWFLVPVWFLLGYENADIDRYYLVPILVTVVWAALAVDALWDLVVAGWRRFAAPGEPPPRRWVRMAVTVVAGAVLLAGALLPVPTRYASADASDDTWAREWVDALLPQLEPDPVVISWWSFSTPLWYARWAEGERPDMTIVDDRDVLDDGLGDLRDVIDGYLGQGRPVYLIRLDDDLPPFEARFELEEVPDIPGATVWHVVGRR